MTNRRIAVLGAGHLGAALIAGMLDAAVADAGDIVATVGTAESAASLTARLGIRVTVRENRQAAAGADLIVLAVDPAAVPEVAAEIRDALDERQIIVSLAASLPLRAIELMLGKPLAVFRALPNIPVVVREGVTALAANSIATEAQRARVTGIFRAVGEVVFVEEKLMHAVTALSGCGPAYIYLVIESLAGGGVKLGLPPGTALRMAAQTVLGAAKHVRESGIDPALLRQQVITPNGATLPAVRTLERLGLRDTLIAAMEAAAQHSQNRSAKLMAPAGAEKDA
jgi:pyrroline-5-carboxylate reductase